MRALFLGLSVVMLVFPAESGAETVWVDADGRVIAPFVDQFYVDDIGVLWHLDAETATLTVPNFSSDTWFYTEPGCQGPPYLPPDSHLPRQVFTTRSCSLPRLRPDDLASREISVASMLFEGDTCLPASGTRRVIPESEMIFVLGSPPDLVARPPLHLERR